MNEQKGGNDEPNHPTAYFAWRAVSVPDGCGGPEWVAVSGRTVAPGCGSIGGWRETNLFAAICWAALGSLAADMIWFYLGQRGKGRIFRVFPDLESRKRTLPQKLHTRLILRGVRMLTAAKFVPFGTVVPLRAGALEAGSLCFFLMDAFSSVVYAAVYVVSGFIFHNQLEEVVAFVRKLGNFALLLVVAAVGAYLGCVFLERDSRRTHPLSQSKIERHQNDRRLITTERPAQFSRVRGGPDLRLAKDGPETNSSSNQARRPDWVLIGHLTFMVFAWAAFAFCIYVIWAKCRGSSPF